MLVFSIVTLVFGGVAYHKGTTQESFFRPSSRRQCSPRPKLNVRGMACQLIEILIVRFVLSVSFET